ncbi:MAG: MBOAT family protein [Lachnospiraceae bacterium]|nr:MBOAT family protein [Lachnospiraceae bacterium]
MLFNSLDFLIFFPIVVLIYFIIPRKIRYIWLLVASYYFYMCWNTKYALLIGISTLITYTSGLIIGKCQKGWSKKLVVALSFVSNLGILVFYKYFDFILENINVVLGKCSMQLVSNPFDIILPVGISFYTFQALSYTVDVYRKEVEPEKNPLKYALFVSFFPQLVAGPIERSKNLLNQMKNIENIKVWNYDRVANGFILMVFGMFQKMVIADRVSVFVDAVYNNLHAVGTMETVFAAVGFSIQIYCDFAAYSTIAIGAAKVMGFEIMENFDTPYFAASIKEFWRRWHISLSSWFKDYLYIPLGGNRKGKIRKYFNLMVTFLVSGLWHGASWNYVVWGGLHGIYQVFGEILAPVRKKLVKVFKVNDGVFSYKLGQILFTFSLTSLTWVFFRAETIREALYFFKRMFTVWNPWVFFNEGLYEYGLDRVEVNILFAALIVLLLAELLKYFKKQRISEFLIEQNLWFRWIVVIGMIVACVVYGEYGISFDSNQFIYFQF